MTDTQAQGAARANSLSARVRAFFDANPDEELTRADMAAKFDTSMASIDRVLLELRGAGVLESVHVIRSMRSNTRRRAQA